MHGTEYEAKTAQEAVHWSEGLGSRCHSFMIILTTIITTEYYGLISHHAGLEGILHGIMLQY